MLEKIPLDVACYLERLWRVSIALRKRFGTGPVIRPLKEEATVRPERSP